MPTACKPNIPRIVGALHINKPKLPHFTEDFEEEELAPAVAELKPKFNEEHSRLRSERQRTLQWHYDIGTIVAKHYADVQRERAKCNQKMYGERFFDRLTEMIPDVPPQLLHKCYRLATVYTPKAFRELTKHDVITPSHALQLAALGDPKDRAYFEAKVIEERLTYKELVDAIKRKFGVRRKPGAGRPMKVPRNVTKALIHLSEQSTAYRHLHEKIWFGEKFNIAEKVPDLPSSLLSDELREQLGDALNACESLASVAEAEAKELRGVIALVDKRMAAQAECDRKAAEEGDE